jgi:hypothetical protein
VSKYATSSTACPKAVPQPTQMIASVPEAAIFTKVTSGRPPRQCAAFAHMSDAPAKVL